MKCLILLLISISSVVSISAQDSWKIKHNSKLLFAASLENELKNTKTIRLSSLDKEGRLDVLYKDHIIRNDWNRSIMIFDENDNELMKKDNVRGLASFSNEDIRSISADHKKLRIFTISIPNDPEQASRVRVRRIHLCTLVLQ